MAKKNVSRGRENVIIGRWRGGAGWDVRMVCSSSLKLAVLASQAVSSAEPGRMGECVNLLVKRYNRQQRWHIEDEERKSPTSLPLDSTNPAL